MFCVIGKSIWRKRILSNPLLYVSMFKPDILGQSSDKEAISFPCHLLRWWFLSFTNYRLKNTVMKIMLKNKALKPRRDNQQARELYFWVEATWDSKFQNRYILDICTEAAEPYGSGHKLIAILIDTNDFFSIYHLCWKHLLYALVLIWSNMKVAMEESWMANFPELFFRVGLTVGSENVWSPKGCRNRPKLPKLVFHTMIWSSNAYKGGREKKSI